MPFTEHNDETNFELEFKIDRIFAALKPIFENNMLAQREFVLPEKISADKSVFYERDFITITSNLYAKSSETKLRSPEDSQCLCEISDNCGNSCLNRAMQMECVSDLCQCGENCQNQNIQKQMVARVGVYRTKNKGYGIKAISPINKGSFIMEYVGEVITKDEYEIRLMMHYSNDMNFYCISLGNEYVIDSRNMGNICRFVNHSCMPNCQMQKWKVDGFLCLALFAIKDIEMGEELTYDYNFTSYKSVQLCFCGTDVCKKIIGHATQNTSFESSEDEQSVIEPIIEPTAGVIEPFIEPSADKTFGKRQSDYRIPKLKPGQSIEPSNRSNYNHNAAGIFRVERSNDFACQFKSPSLGQSYGCDSAGTYRISNFRQHSKKSNHNSNYHNKMSATANSNRIPNFSKGSKNEFSRAQNRCTQTPAAAGSSRLEGFQMNQRVLDAHEKSLHVTVDCDLENRRYLQYNFLNNSFNNNSFKFVRINSFNF